MLHSLWTNILYKPLVNVLALLVAFIPGGDVGIAIVVLTVLVKVIIYPLTKKQIVSQAKMNLLTPELNKIKQSNASKEEQARLTFELYKKHKTNPFSGCWPVLIQLPILFALYYAFFKGINFGAGTLYSFVKTPEHVNMVFLGLLDLTHKSVLLAVIAGISQYFQALYMPKPAASGNSTLQDSFQSSMQIQMKYIFPLGIALLSYSVSGALALYWATSNIFAVLQQIHISRKKIAVTVHGEKRVTEAE
jgi:YidC/Oxa1 family membrane protein insertase